MSDRLKELQRQRASAQEQLAWFDREIARESGQPSLAERPSDPIVVAPTAPSASVPSPVPPAAEAKRLADEIIARYKDEHATSPADVKRGCFLYFGLAFLLVAAGLVALYFYSASRQ